MIVALIANGAPDERAFLSAELDEADYVIAVDGGMSALEQIGRWPDVLVGDLDSYDYDARAHTLPAELEVIKLAVEKDLLDLEFAIQLAVQRGATALRLYNALGARLDHTLTNFNVLLQANQFAVTAELRTVGQRLIVGRAHQELVDIKGQTFSIVPVSDLTRLSISGAKYNLTAQDVARASSRCLSNIATADVVTISVDGGDFYIICLD